jgi:uncharacterized surface protein with fasciclin (FAS1) repeats
MTTMYRSRIVRAIAALFALSLLAAACSDGGDDSATSDTTAADTGSDSGTSGSGNAVPADTTKICDKDGLVQAVESGPEAGTLAGMTDDPVATAASNNPVLTTLVQAVGEANLGDTLNSAPALTVFAPTDCAFAALDKATLDAALADPTGLLTQVLGFHVVPGEQLSSADLASETKLATVNGAELEVSDDGGTITVGGGQAKVVVPDIHTANATVHLIDHVMVPPAG